MSLPTASWRYVVGSNRETVVGPYTDSVALSEIEAKPLRVALLGCGTVGGGVYQRLAAQPEVFDVAGVGTRNVQQAIAAGVPAGLITGGLEALIAEPVDVVVELLGGEEPARALVARALRLGKNIVTANKALLAHDLAALQNLAAMNGVLLLINAWGVYQYWFHRKNRDQG